jgi:hypothetical protein
MAKALPKSVRLGIIALVIVVVLIVGLPYIIPVTKPTPRRETKIEAMVYTPEEVETLKNQVTAQRDGDAAFDLYNYFATIANDTAKAEEYLQTAKRLGHRKAIEIVGSRNGK